MEPEVTVAIPTIPGREEKLQRAIESAMAQTWECRITTFEDTDRKGAAYTRNRLLDRISTTYIAWLDDDDVLLPNHVEVLLRAAKEVEADLVYPTPTMVGMKQEHMPLRTMLDGKLVVPWGVPFGDEQRHHLIWKQNFIPITHLVLTDKLRSIGGFPYPNSKEWPHRNCEDWAMVRKLAKTGANIHHVDKVTWEWHVWGGHTDGRGKPQ